MSEDTTQTPTPSEQTAVTTTVETETTITETGHPGTPGDTNDNATAPLEPEEQHR